MIEKAYKKDPKVVTKHVIPLCFRLLNETKSTMKSAAISLVKTLYSIMGDDFFSLQTSVHEISKLKEYIS